MSGSLVGEVFPVRRVEKRVSVYRGGGALYGGDGADVVRAEPDVSVIVVDHVYMLSLLRRNRNGVMKPS